GPAVRMAANGDSEVAPMRFGWPAPRPKAAPVFNFRSDGRSLVRVHGDEISQDEAPLHAGFRPTVLHRRIMETWRGQPARRLHHADHRTRPGRGAIPRPTDRCPSARRLARLAGGQLWANEGAVRP